MNPENLELETIDKLFEYEKYARDIDSISDIEELKKLAKCYFKLYLKQQEVIANF